MRRLLGRVRHRSVLEDDDRLLRETAASTGCALIAQCDDRSIVTLRGELRSVTLRPIDGVSCLEAELYDGSDSVTLIWLGRRQIEGIAAGRRLTVHGRIGRRDTERILYNPRYDLAV